MAGLEKNHDVGTPWSDELRMVLLCDDQLLESDEASVLCGRSFYQR